VFDAQVFSVVCPITRQQRRATKKVAGFFEEQKEIPMSRTIILSISMLAAILATLHYMDAPAESGQNEIAAEMAKIADERAALMVNYRNFKGTLDAALDALTRREITLEEATARVYNAGKQYCPIYLDRVCISDPTPKLETSIAKNLVGHVYSLEEVHPQLAERTAELERELEKLVNNSECSNVR
jgi:hypothetical protein